MIHFISCKACFVIRNYNLSIIDRDKFIQNRFQYVANAVSGLYNINKKQKFYSLPAWAIVKDSTFWAKELLLYWVM
jgi:hypothetical protein